MSDSPVVIESFGPRYPGPTLPQFWRTDPCLWFAAAESQFLVHQIDTEQIKFAYVVSALQLDVAKELRDLIIVPPATNPYNCIKQRLCSPNARLQEKNTKEQLMNEQLVFEQPSELLRHLEHKLDEPYPEDNLKSVFIQKLPVWIRQVMDPVSDELGVIKLAELADRIVTQTEPIQTRTEIDQFRETLGEVKLAIQKLSEYIETTHKLCNTNKEIKICWYHRHYGGKAYKCNRTCVLSHTSLSSKNNQAETLDSTELQDTPCC